MVLGMFEMIDFFFLCGLVLEIEGLELFLEGLSRFWWGFLGLLGWLEFHREFFGRVDHSM